MEFKFAQNLPSSPEWRRLICAAIISTAGSQLTRIALFAKVFELGGNLQEFAFVALVQALPALLVAPLAATLSDRLDKATMLVTADMARCLLLIGVAVTTSLPTLYLLATLFAVSTSVFEPVEAAFESELLTEEEIPHANALRTATIHMLTSIGPAIGGGLLLAVAVPVLLVIDAASYLVSAILLVALRGVWSPATERPKAGFVLTFREGLTFIASRTDLLLVFGMSAVVFLLLGMQGPLFFAFTLERFGGNGEAFGIFMAALGTGGVLGAALFRRYRAILAHPLVGLCLVLGIDAMALFGFTLTGSLVICIACMVVMGLVSAFYLVIVRSFLQTAPPPAFRSRVLGWFWGLQGPLVALSLALATALANIFDSTQILQGAAIGELAATAVFALLVFLSGSRRIGSRKL